MEIIVIYKCLLFQLIGIFFFFGETINGKLKHQIYNIGILFYQPLYRLFINYDLLALAHTMFLVYYTKNSINVCIVLK